MSVLCFESLCCSRTQCLLVECSGATRSKELYEQYLMAPEQQQQQQQQPFADAQQQQHVVFASDDYRDALNNARFKPLDEAGMGIALQQLALFYQYADPYGNLYMQHSLDVNDVSMRPPPAVSFAGFSFLPPPPQQQQHPAPQAPVAASHVNYASNNNHLHAHGVLLFSRRLFFETLT